MYKKDDFFDMLSCEALGGGVTHATTATNDWRSKMIEQKRIDMETFGGLGGVRHTAFGRGRGGHGGRGGGRGMSTGIPAGAPGGGGGGGGGRVSCACAYRCLLCGCMI